jgi:hypothetical protein
LKDIVAIYEKVFGSTEAREIAENVLFTNANWCGWPKKHSNAENTF